MQEQMTYGYVSTGQAAERLGVSAHQIGELVRAGELEAQRTAGNNYLVHAASMARYSQIRKGSGRPLRPQTAYAAYWLLSGLEVSWLDYFQLRRLRESLLMLSVEDLVWRTRKRATPKTFRASHSYLERIEKTLAFCAPSTEAFSLVGRPDYVEGYIRADDEPGLVSRFHLQPDPEGNVCLRVSPWLPEGFSMPIALQAADMAESLESRMRSAGTAKLRELLRAFA